MFSDLRVVSVDASFRNLLGCHRERRVPNHIGYCVVQSMDVMVAEYSVDVCLVCDDRLGTRRDCH